MAAAQSEQEREFTGAPFAPDLHDARHLKLKAALLCLWLLASFGVSYFARDLAFEVGPWPLSYWMASQGAVLVFIALAWIYCAVMDHFERQDGQDTRAGPDG